MSLPIRKSLRVSCAQRSTLNAKKVGGYDEIVLVGHSFGGLMVRYAYLLGFGAIEKSEVDE